MSQFLSTRRLFLLASVAGLLFLAPSFAEARSPMPAPGVCENGYGTNVIDEASCKWPSYKECMTKRAGESMHSMQALPPDGRMQGGSKPVTMSPKVNIAPSEGW
jgi:hypothetical protein